MVHAPSVSLARSGRLPSTSALPSCSHRPSLSALGADTVYTHTPTRLQSFFIRAKISDTCETLLCNHVASNNSFYSGNLWDVLDSLPKNVQEPFTTNPMPFHFDGFNKTIHSMDMNNTPHYISPLFANVPSSVFEPQIEVRDFDAQTQIPMVSLHFN